MFSIHKTIVFSTFASELHWLNQGKMDKYLSLSSDSLARYGLIQQSSRPTPMKIMCDRQSYKADTFCARVILCCSFRHIERPEKGLSKRLEKVFDIHSERILKGKTSLRNAERSWFNWFHKPYPPHIKGSLVFWGWLVKLNLKLSFLSSYQRFVVTELR